MSDENKPHDDHGPDAGHGHDDPAPTPVAPAPDDHHHGETGHIADDPVAEAVLATEAAHDAHDHHGATGHTADDPVADPVPAHGAVHDAHDHDLDGETGHTVDDPVAEAVPAHEATHAPHDDGHVTPADATATSSRQPVWSDSGDAPFEDVEATPVYARGKRGKKKGKSGGGNETFEIVKTVFFALLIALVLRVLLFQPFTIPSASMEPNLYEGDYIVVSKWSYGYSKHAIPFSPPLFEGRIFAREPERGDIVVFKLPRDDRTDYVKRLIGLPGDRVQMINNVLHINNQPVPDVALSEQAATNMYGMKVIKARETLPEGRSFIVQDFGPGYDADDTAVFEVPAGHYFMMGDNRDNSVDSRFGEMDGVGLVPAENLIGKAEIILFSWKPGASLWNPVSWFSKVQPSRFFTVLD